MQEIKFMEKKKLQSILISSDISVKGAMQKLDDTAVYTIFAGWLDIGQWEEYRESLKQMGVKKNV